VTGAVCLPSVWVTLLLLSGICGYGFWSEGLFEQVTWTSLGLARLERVAAIYIPASVAVCLWRRSFAVPLFSLLAALYSVVAVGPLALLCVLFFLSSSFLLGRLLFPGEGALDDLLALLLGIGIWILLIGTAAHFPVNTPLTYCVAFLIPFVAGRRLIRPALGAFVGRLRAEPNSPGSCAALVLLLFVVLIHYLGTLKPEVSHDGLSMHMVIASRLAAHSQWPFDVQEFVWAVMPMGGDWAFAGVYMLGGEYAARLLNLSFFLMIAGLVFAASRRWLSMAEALLLTALFATTPLIQVVTGALFVENVWAMFVTAAVLSLWKYHDSRRPAYFVLAGLFLGCSMQVKYGSWAILPVVLPLAVWEWKRSRQAGRTSLAALATLPALLIVFGAPPYLTALVKTGNPIFPFLNHIFQSPYFDAFSAYRDMRWPAELQWNTLYNLTFRSDKYLEGQAGSFGFQYLLLLPLSIPLVFRRRSYLAAVALGVGLTYCVLTCLYVTYLRYLYPVLPLFMIVIAWVTAELRSQQIRLYRTLQVLVVALIFLNGYFIPTSGWAHRDLYLNPFNQAEMSRYIEIGAPQRPLIEYLNAHAPGSKVAFLTDDAQIAPLDADAVAGSWHFPDFSQRLREANSAQDLYALMEELSIEYYVAPTPDDSAPAQFPAVPLFLREYTAPEVLSPPYYLARLIREPEPRLPGPGVYDDTDSSVLYRGAWTLDNQFEKAANGTISYTNHPGAGFRFEFEGVEVSWVYTKAPNRGMAAVSVDGEEEQTVDMYSPGIRWQSRTTLSGLGNSEHVLEVRVLEDKHPDATHRFVDVDQIIVK